MINYQNTNDNVLHDSSTDDLQTHEINLAKLPGSGIESASVEWICQNTVFGGNEIRRKLYPGNRLSLLILN